MPARDTRTVVESHLALARDGDVEGDLSANYAPDVVLLTGEGAFHGHDGVRRLADVLLRELPDADFVYRSVVVAERFALLEWSAHSPAGMRVDDGADGFVVEDGLIRAQTIHYTVMRRVG
jgi:hypothetical protein